MGAEKATVRRLIKFVEFWYEFLFFLFKQLIGNTNNENITSL